MKLLIILNGECNDFEFLHSLSEKYDCVYCADGGYNNALKADVVPELVLGDFDSADMPKDIKTKRFPVEKDDTDTEIAIKTGASNNFSKITLTCALGGRCDHFMTNILMLSRFDNVDIEESNCHIEVITDCKELNDICGKTVSIIPLEKSFVELDGFKYPLCDEIQLGTTRTMSNIVVSDKALIKIKYGRVIIIITK